MERLARQLRRVWHSVPLLLATLVINPVESFIVFPPSSTASGWRTPCSTQTGIFLPHPSAIRGPSCSQPFDKRDWTDKVPTERCGIKLVINRQMDIEALPEPSEGSLGLSVNLLQPEGSVKVRSKQESSNGMQMNARSLESVRNTLIRQEETIIFALIERGQFRQNSAIYSYNKMFRLNKPGEDGIFGRDASFVEYVLCETEKLHATGLFRVYVNDDVVLIHRSCCALCIWLRFVRSIFYQASTDSGRIVLNLPRYLYSNACTLQVRTSAFSCE